jgi:hypothetical protein
MTSLICNSEHRREAVRQQSDLSGLDYLDVGPDQTTLTVHFWAKTKGRARAASRMW